MKSIPSCSEFNGTIETGKEKLKAAQEQLFEKYEANNWNRRQIVFNRHHDTEAITIIDSSLMYAVCGGGEMCIATCILHPNYVGIESIFDPVFNGQKSTAW